MDHVGLVDIGCNPIKFDDFIPLRDDQVFQPIHSNKSMNNRSLCRATELHTTQQNIVPERAEFLHNSEPILDKHISPKQEKNNYNLEYDVGLQK